MVCYRCGRSGHIKPQCYAKTHKKGYNLSGKKKGIYRKKRTYRKTYY